MTTVFIISAPSGSGKSTLVARLLSRSAGADVFGLVHHAAAAGPRGRRAELSFRLPRRVRSACWRATSFWNGPRFSATITAPTAAAGAGPGGGQGSGARHRRARCGTIKRARFRKPLRFSFWLPPAQILEQRLRARGQDSDAVIERRLRRGGRGDPQLQAVRLRAGQQRAGGSDDTLAGDRAGRAGAADRMEDQIRPILETFVNDRG